MARFRIDKGPDESGSERRSVPHTEAPADEPSVAEGAEPRPLEFELPLAEAGAEIASPQPAAASAPAASAPLWRKWWLLALAALLGLEVVLRLLGIPDAGFSEVGVLEADPVLGWRDPMQSIPTRPGVILVGEGEFGEQIRAQIGDIELNELGAVGYSTHQSVLALERLLAGNGPVPLLAVYLFRESHEARNAAAMSWLYRVSRLPTLGDPGLPFVTFEDGRLKRHRPLQSETWPLRRFALVGLAEQRFLGRDKFIRENGAREATEAVLLEMDALVARNTIAFRVIVIEASDEAREHYQSFLETNDIDHVDCVGDQIAGCVALSITR